MRLFLFSSVGGRWPTFEENGHRMGTEKRVSPLYFDQTIPFSVRQDSPLVSAQTGPRVFSAANLPGVSHAIWGLSTTRPRAEMANFFQILESIARITASAIIPVDGSPRLSSLRWFWRSGVYFIKWNFVRLQIWSDFVRASTTIHDNYPAFTTQHFQSFNDIFAGRTDQ